MQFRHAGGHGHLVRAGWLAGCRTILMIMLSETAETAGVADGPGVGTHTQTINLTRRLPSKGLAALVKGLW